MDVAATPILALASRVVIPEVVTTGPRRDVCVALDVPRGRACPPYPPSRGTVGTFVDVYG